MAEIKYNPDLITLQGLAKSPMVEEVNSPVAGLPNAHASLRPRMTTLRDKGMDVLMGLGLDPFVAGNIYDGLAQTTPLMISEGLDQLRLASADEPISNPDISTPLGEIPGETISAFDAVLGILGWGGVGKGIAAARSAGGKSTAVGKAAESKATAAAGPPAPSELDMLIGLGNQKQLAAPAKQLPAPTTPPAVEVPSAALVKDFNDVVQAPFDPYALKLGEKVDRKKSRSTDFTDSTRGLPRKPEFWHGTKTGEEGDAIVGSGFTKGESAELLIPGTSLSRNPEVSARFTGSSLDSQLELTRPQLHGFEDLPEKMIIPGKSPEARAKVLQQETDATAEQMRGKLLIVELPDSVLRSALNIAPSDYARRTSAELAKYAHVNKSMAYYNENELWARGEDGRKGQSFLTPRHPNEEELARASRIVRDAEQEKQNLTALQYWSQMNGTTAPKSIGGQVGPSAYRNILAEASRSESRAFRAAWWYSQRHIETDGDDAETALEYLADFQTNRPRTADEVDDLLNNYHARGGPSEQIPPEVVRSKFAGWSEEDLQWVVALKGKYSKVRDLKDQASDAASILRDVRDKQEVIDKMPRRVERLKKNLANLDSFMQDIRSGYYTGTALYNEVRALDARHGTDFLEAAKVHLNPEIFGSKDNAAGQWEHLSLRAMIEDGEFTIDNALRVLEETKARKIDELGEAAAELSDNSSAARRQLDLLLQPRRGEKVGPEAGLNIAHREMTRARHDLYDFLDKSRRSHALEEHERRKIKLDRDAARDSELHGEGS